MHAEGDPARLLDMHQFAIDVRDFVAGRSYEQYVNDKMLRRAVERSIEIIGEAARNVSPAFQAAHPQVPWRLIVAQRHVLAHEYGEIKDERIWRVATVHIPELIASLRGLIGPPPTLP